MPAQLRRIAIGIQHQRHRVPARQSAYAVFKILVADGALLFAQRYGIAIRSDPAERDSRAGDAGFADKQFEQEMGAFCAFVFQY